MRFALMTFLTLTFLGVAAMADICSSAIGRCEYYSCLTKQQGCSADAVIPRIGQRYCVRYERHEAEFSPAGQLFLRQVRRCLQEQVEASAPTDCAQAGRTFLRVHVSCYLAADYCSLSYMDRARVAWIGRALLWDGEIRRTGQVIETACYNRRSNSDRNSNGFL